MKLGEEFQNIVSQIVQQLTPSYNVKSPDKILGVNSNTMREIDVAVRFKDGMSDYLIMIECRDRNRPCDISYIEQMKTKREDIQANKVIIVSRHGFTSSAKILGEKLGFDLYELNNAQNFDWNKMIGITEVEIHQPRYEIVSLDLILGEEKGIPPLKGILEQKGNIKEFEIYDDKKNPRDDNLMDIINFNVNKNIDTFKKLIPHYSVATLPVEFRMRFLLYVKIDKYFRPVNKMRAVLNVWIDTYMTPLLLSNKNILTDSYSGETVARYVELDFEVQKQNIAIALVQPTK